MLTISSIGFALTTIVFALSGSPIFSGALLFIIGIGMIINNALINGLLQERVPNALRGRVMSIYVMVYVGMNPIGSFVAGWIARQSSASWAIGGMASLMLIFAAWAFRRYPELRHA
jgi:MFS family permease